MFRKSISVILILAVALCTLCACGKSKEVSILVPISSDPLCLDPQIAETDSAKLIVSNCYEGLVRLNDKYEIIPGVAKTWDVSADGLTYTFHLRTDSNWQLLNSYKDVLNDENYKENFKTTVTANDFQFALRRALDPVTQANDAEKLFCINNAEAVNSGKVNASSLGVSATDSSTLVIKLERANPDFLRILTLPVCMPCNEEFFTATHAKYGLELKYTFCNGPFYLAKWTQDNSLSILKNEGYQGEQNVGPSGVYFYINGDEDQVLSKLKQSSYDCAFLSDTAHKTLVDNKKITQISVSNTVGGLCFNCTDSILKNQNIRKALVMMTKLSEVSKPADATGSATGIVPDCCRFGSEQYRKSAGNTSNIAYNEKTAVELWSRGLTELELESADITISCTEDISAQMQQAIQNWQKLLGTLIIAKVEVVSSKDLNTAIKNDKYQIAYSSISTDSSTATDTLKIFESDNTDNIFNYGNTSYDSMVNKIITSASGSQIISQCKAAEQMLIDNAVFCPLFTYSQYLAIGKKVTGVFVYPALESISFINGGRS